MADERKLQFHRVGHPSTGGLREHVVLGLENSERMKEAWEFAHAWLGTPHFGGGMEYHCEYQDDDAQWVPCTHPRRFEDPRSAWIQWNQVPEQRRLAAQLMVASMRQGYLPAVWKFQCALLLFRMLHAPSSLGLRDLLAENSAELAAKLYCAASLKSIPRKDDVLGFDFSEEAKMEELQHLAYDVLKCNVHPPPSNASKA